MEDLVKLAKKAKFAELETAWTSALAEGALDVDALLRVPRTLADRGQPGEAESLVWYLVDALRERGRGDEAFRAAHEGALMLPASRILREMLAELYVKDLADRPDAPVLVRHTVQGALALDEAVRCLDRLLTLAPGAYVLDARRADVGRVIEFDAEEGQLRVEFSGEQRAYAPAFVPQLEPLAEDDFRALLAFERESVRKLAEEDPEELMRLLLGTMGRRMELRRVRLYVEPVVGSWPRWWSAASKRFQRSADIGLTQGSSPSIFLRSKPLSLERRLLRRMRALLTDPVAMLTVALDMLRHCRTEQSVDVEAVAEAAEEVRRVAEDASRPVVALAAAGVLDEFARRFPDEVPQGPALGASFRPEDAAGLGELERSPAVGVAALEFVRRTGGAQWPAVAASVMPRVPREVCDAVAERLIEAGADQALAEAIQWIMTDSGVHPGAVCWLWRDCSREGSPVAGMADPSAVMLRLLSVASSVVRDASLTNDQRRDRVAELRAALFVRNGEALERVLRAARPEQLASVKGVIEHHPVLTEQMQARASRLLSELAPALYVRRVEVWEESVVYTTAAGLQNRRDELARIVTERLPAIFREIGQAAAQGDITDNADFQSAIHERGRLATLAQGMEQEIENARPIAPEMADVDHVTVGSRVRARNLATGQEEVFQFLGPWDADPERGIYAYNAPLGLAFMGARPGQGVTYRIGTEERRWEVLETGPAL